MQLNSFFFFSPASCTKGSGLKHGGCKIHFCARLWFEFIFIAFKTVGSYKYITQRDQIFNDKYTCTTILQRSFIVSLECFSWSFKMTLYCIIPLECFHSQLSSWCAAKLNGQIFYGNVCWKVQHTLQGFQAIGIHFLVYSR